MLAAAILLFGLVSAHAQAPSDQSQPPPAVNPVPEVPPPPQQSSPPPQLDPGPLLTPLPPSLSGGPAIPAKLQQSAETRVKSPFMLPKEIYLRLMKKKSEVVAEGFVDLSIEAKRRWALKYYKLVAVIWNVKNPKAMILDRDGKMHMFKEKDYIGNQEGFISEINNGEVVVLERGAEIKLNMQK